MRKLFVILLINGIVYAQGAGFTLGAGVARNGYINPVFTEVSLLLNYEVTPRLYLEVRPNLTPAKTDYQGWGIAFDTYYNLTSWLNIIAAVNFHSNQEQYYGYKDGGILRKDFLMYGFGADVYLAPYIWLETMFYFPFKYESFRYSREISYVDITHWVDFEGLITLEFKVAWDL